MVNEPGRPNDPVWPVSGVNRQTNPLSPFFLLPPTLNFFLQKMSTLFATRPAPTISNAPYSTETSSRQRPKGRVGGWWGRRKRKKNYYNLTRDKYTHALLTCRLGGTRPPPLTHTHTDRQTSHFELRARNFERRREFCTPHPPSTMGGWWGANFHKMSLAVHPQHIAGTHRHPTATQKIWK